mgnify:CR=1 FL=1|tara:strand:+ start:536 stop:1066 length:531 start_codon:yes stop_codon:yes gene_type:complete
MIEYNKTKLADGKSSIICDNGDCFIESNVDIMGIEIDFIGKAKITPTLPDGWIMQGNKSKMLLFTLQNLPIKNQKLFTYFGSIKINNIIIVNNDAKSIFCEIKNVNPTWIRQDWSMDLEADNWDNFKSKVQKGKVSKTKYNLPDYGLPKVDKTKIKKTRRTTATYSSGSSRGSGGY